MALQTYAITILSGLQFTVVSDLTGYFEEYRPILLVGDTQTRLYVNSSSYDLVLTTVTVSGGTIPASASGVAIGDLSITNSAIPYEYLDTLYVNTSEMTTISGDLVSYIDTISGGLQTQIDAIDTSNYYTKTEVDTISGSLHSEIENIDLTTLSGDLVIGYTGADTTLSGLLHAEIVAASGTTDHSVLDNLDYISSGHTGFQPAGDYVTEAEFTTYSGDIISYVDQEIVALSGSIVLDHGGLTGLSDDDHTQYALVNAGRNITGQQTFENDVVVRGNFTVSGSQFITETETVLIEDNQLVINYGETASGVTTGVAGIEVDRGTAENYYFRYDEADDNFQVGSSGSMQAVATREDTPTANAFGYWNASQFRFDTSANYTTSTIVTEAEFTTYSGDIINQIPTDFYTTGQVDAISGALHSEIDDIDLNYISNAEMTVISGDIIAYVDVVGNNIYNAGTAYTDAAVSGVTSSLTSHTSDTDIHFTEASIRHSVIDGLDGDDHTQYLTEARGDARYYTEGEVDSISGSIVAKIITDHGGLTGRLDDDHTQYILVNGNRAFTGTVAGITPSEDEHLATKGYVDAAWGTGLSVAAGTQVLVSGTSSTTIDFGIEFLSTGYGVACEMQNLVDANPSIYDMTITNVTTSGFSLEFSGVIDSDNYYLRYTAIASGTISATDHGALSGLLDDDHPQYYNEARGDARYYTQAQVDSISGTLESTKADVVHGHVKADISDFGTPMNNVVEDTTPQLGGNLDLNGKCLNYGVILTSSGTYTGEILTVVVDDAATVFGSVLCQGADFHYDRADADAVGTSPVYCMALEVADGTKTALLKGQVCDTNWNWAAGKVYLSGTIGTMTQTKPSTTGQQIQVLGFALSPDTIWFDPVTMVAEVA